jgi:hypothetical protein
VRIADKQARRRPRVRVSQRLASSPSVVDSLVLYADHIYHSMYRHGLTTNHFIPSRPTFDHASCVLEMCESLGLIFSVSVKTSEVVNVHLCQRSCTCKYVGVMKFCPVCIGPLFSYYPKFKVKKGSDKVIGNCTALTSFNRSHCMYTTIKGSKITHKK